MTEQDRLEELFAQYVEQRVVHGTRPRVEDLCRECPELVEPLRDLARRYELVDETLTMSAAAATPQVTALDESLPNFEGLRTIERLGGGGGGEVYKLEDISLGRVVAAKVLCSDHALGTNVENFLQEARTLALFDNPRIVRIFEFRGKPDPPVLFMEFVDGFELSHMGPSLEYSQRARLMAEVADAIHYAHSLGIQHRDLKPTNILVDAQLSPRILDFGLAGSDPHSGHFFGTPAYMAPEQLDPGRPIDDRTDVYALGVILYELLCGVLPFRGETQDELTSAIRAGEPKLPVEIAPKVPEGLQAIALKAMETNPTDRYGSAREMALDLKRYIGAKPVVARPTVYQSTLQRRLLPHLQQIREWLRIKLIYPHEAERLDKAYQSLKAREDDWIVESRSLSFSQISLYMGAFLLFCGSLLYFVAYRKDAFSGLAKPLIELALPFVALNVAAHVLCRREYKAVSVAFYLGSAVLLPLFLLIVFQEAGLWAADPENNRELFAEGFASNRQLQVAGLLACAWAFRLAFTTRTVALSACSTFFLLIFNFAVLADFDLRGWFAHARYDLLAIYLVPCFLVLATSAYMTERRQRPWLARPMYFAALVLFVTIFELLALKGKAFEYLGVSMVGFQPSKISNPALLDTVAAMTLNGVIIYFAGWALEKRGTVLMKYSANLLFLISPFTMLEPLAYLNEVSEYSLRFNWLYLGLALGITFASHFRQRKSFYYAGLVNTASALWLITDHYEWFDHAAWATVVIVVGVVALLAGFGLDVKERRRRVT